MNLDLDKEDLISLVMGSELSSYSQMEIPIVAKGGRFIGGFHDKWEWDKSKLNLFTEDELYNLYKTIKDGKRN